MFCLLLVNGVLISGMKGLNKISLHDKVLSQKNELWVWKTLYWTYRQPTWQIYVLGCLHALKWPTLIFLLLINKTKFIIPSSHVPFESFLQPNYTKGILEE